MDENKVGTMMQSAAKVPLSELNECITCKLCRGYFIDATTIIECLHTFCRSCIVRYLESNKYCPICDVQVHKTKPLLNLRSDKTIQDLVYKLVPRLYQNEIQKRKSFYEAHPEGKSTLTEQAPQYDYILAPEECVNLTLHYHGCGAAPRYLRCPSAVLVTHLKKLIRAKYELTEHHRVDVFYNQDCLNPSFSLMDISYIYSWKKKDPLDLTYKIYECRAKKPKLDTTDNGDHSAQNNNNNNWKEVQLRISENGEMSITGIEDSSMLELLDATENFKNEFVINEGKNLENFPKPIQVDADIGNSEVKIQAKASENAPTTNKQLENAQKPVENHLATPKKELPGLKLIGKSSSSSCTLPTLTTTKASGASTKQAKSGTKTVTSGAKTGNSASKTVNSGNKASLEAKKVPSASTEASKASSSSSSTKTSSTKPTKTSSDTKSTKNSMPKSIELSATLNLNSELSVIPLSASTSCVSLTSCGGTTTVFSTINKSMCSTRMENSDVQNSGGCDGKSQGFMICSKENPTESTVNNISKESKNLKRKCEEDEKTMEVPAKLPKPTILNHSIGLMNLSNNHPLKKHSKMNRNGEHLLKAPEISEKAPISTPTLTVNHVSVSQKHISMDCTPAKPIIINKNVSSLQINRPGTPKSAQKGGQGGNVPCYANKTVFNSVASLTKLERNGDKMEGTQGKTEVLNSVVNSIPKSSLHHHVPSYQTSHHTPIITPSQLPHHQNINSLQLKPPACSNSTHNQEKTDPKTSQGYVATSQGNAAASLIATSQTNMIASQLSASSLTSLKTSIASSLANLTSKSNVTVLSQKRSDVSHDSSQPSQLTIPHSVATNHLIHASTLSSAPSSVHNTPPTSAPSNHAPASIKTKPSTPIGYKTLRDPPKSWNSQINSQIARVNQNVKAQQLANAASLCGGTNAQGRFVGDLKSVRPAKFFKGRNMPRYLGCPASGVKPMYQLQTSSDKDKPQELQIAPQIAKSEKSEIKKHSIVKIDPKTLRPISEKAPETSNLSNITSNLTLGTNQNNQELRINSSQGDLKINTSSVSIFNPLKLQSSPKSERKSPKSPHSPKVKSSPNGSNTSAATTNTTPSSPSPNTLSPKQHRDKTNLTFTPPNPFVPNLTSPTLSPNQFLYPAGGFPSYDPRVMAAYHSLWYTQRMAAAAAAGFVPPPMPHAFGMNIGINTGTTTIGQQQHNPGISPKHSTPPKSSGQPSPRGGAATPSQPKASPTPPNKKTKEPTARNEKSLETALNKLSQNKAKELSNNKQQQVGGSKKVGGNKLLVENNVPVDATPKVVGGSKISGGLNCLGDPQQRVSSKELGASDAQQNRVKSTMSALEKLSQNKAIEILGGSLLDGKDKPAKGHSTPPVIEDSSNEIAKRQSSPTTKSNCSQETQPAKSMLSSAQSQNKVEEVKLVSTSTSAPSESKSVSPELQTRLGCCPDPLNDQNSQQEKINSELGQNRLEEGHNRSEEGQNQVENRLNQDQNGSAESRTGSVSSETISSAKNEIKAKNAELGDGSKCQVENKGSDIIDLQVTFSDNIDKVEVNSEEKQSSDIKASSSRSSVDMTNGNTGTVESSDNIANGKALGNIAEEVSVALVVGDKSDNVENKSDSVTESDKGGGEKM